MASILIIEDNTDHRDIFGRLLATAGHRAIGAAAEVEGLECARQQIPDLIVLDIRLPDTDGWTVAIALRSDPRTQHIPVLIMTAEPLARELLTKPGFEYDAILLKPFDISSFLSAVARLLALQSSPSNPPPSEITLQRHVGRSRKVPEDLNGN